METIFIIMVGILILLAVTDLVVGVSNDAVNFLVSALGSKAAPVRIIMIIASLGVIFGATFSNGMMEIARKGIFVPELFSFNEIMIIFLTVMLTDIILLDAFNTLGLPTSTTVSLIFELLGSAVAMSIMLVITNNQSFTTVSNYINTGRVLLIIGGILFSVIVAFTVGAIVQYFSRMLFTFGKSKSYKYFGAVWGGLALTSIVYFLLIKGLKGSVFIHAVEFVKQYSTQILFGSFILWTIIFAIIQIYTKFNFLKIVVLAGTFALAMAFAGNDLVNFIGVPLAGISSYTDWAANGNPSPDTFMMGSLQKPVTTPLLYLAIAGIIMVLTLWFSKKAKGVTATSLALSRQEEGYERFESSVLSRSIVRFSINMSKTFSGIIPQKAQNWIDKRFEQNAEISEKTDKSFDLIRASVNLMVSGILIAIGTAYKLPLSTTYVTFMVAMGTSLSDRAWGRDSAVYRISGVLTVIAGWFITALVAFTVAFIFAVIIFKGGIFAVLIILAIGIFSAIKSNKFHTKKQAETAENKSLTELINDDINIYARCTSNVITIFKSVEETFSQTIEALGKQDRKKLRKIQLKSAEISKKSKLLKDNIYHTVNKLKEDSIDTAPYYVQVLDYLREITHALDFIVEPILNHTENHHKPLLDKQIEVLKLISETLNSLSKIVISTIETENYESNEDHIKVIQTDLLAYLNEARKIHLKRIKNKEVSTRNSILYLNILSETKNITLYYINAYKSYRDFVLQQKKISNKIL